MQKPKHCDDKPSLTPNPPISNPCSAASCPQGPQHCQNFLQRVVSLLLASTVTASTAGSARRSEAVRDERRMKRSLHTSILKATIMEVGRSEETSRFADLLRSSAICNTSSKLFKVCKDRFGGVFADILLIIGSPVTLFVSAASQNTPSLRSGKLHKTPHW